MTALAGLKLSLSMGFGNANSPKRGFGLAQRLKGLEDENRAEEAAGRGDAGCFGAEGHPGKKLIEPAARRSAALRLIAERGFMANLARRGGDAQTEPEQS
jgi:hypothetical protein